MSNALNDSMTLRQIALENPACIPTLEELGLDYCCGGQRTLGEAVEEKEFDGSSVIRMLERDIAKAAEQDTRDWREASMTELADHIEQTHHEYVRKSLAHIGALLDRVAGHHGEDYPELIELQDVVGEFAEDMYDHMIREERVVFPWLRRLDQKTSIHSGPPWSVRRPISCMEHDHDEAGEALRTIRRLTNDYTAPEGTCMSFAALFSALEDLERDTHIHIHKENNILFPAGVEAEQQKLGKVPA